MSQVRAKQPTICETAGDYDLPPMALSVLEYLNQCGIASAKMIQSDLNLSDHYWKKTSAILRNVGMIEYRHMRGYRVSA